MAYLEQLAAQLQQTAQQINRDTAQMFGASGVPYAEFYPPYESSTPQYVQPTPYFLTQQGFRQNELVYACINERAFSVSEAPIAVYDVTDDNKPIIEDHPLHLLLNNPCPTVPEQLFWEMTEIWCDIAGFAAWEKERNNQGDVIALWPMRPDFCSFIRAPGKPIGYIRYQPYGLSPKFTPIEDVVLFQYFDPLYPLLKGFSPTMAALNLIHTDNTMTQMVDNFLSHSGFLGGVLTTEQVIQDAEAERIRARWRDQHGGVENAGDIAVFGKGVTFAPTTTNFRNMVFPEVDGRSETRICATFHVSPVLLAVKTGLSVATYNNYKEARKAFYEHIIQRQWNFFASQLWEQLLPEFEKQQSKFLCKFDTSDVKAVQDDRASIWTSALESAKHNVLTRDEAREEMGYKPIDNKPIFIGVTVREMIPPGEDAGAVGEESAQGGQLEGKPIVLPKLNPPAQTGASAIEAAQAAEAKQFKAFAKRVIKEGKGDVLMNFVSFVFKHSTPDQQAELLREAIGEEKLVDYALLKSIDAAVRILS